MAKMTEEEEITVSWPVGGRWVRALGVPSVLVARVLMEGLSPTERP